MDDLAKSADGVAEVDRIGDGEIGDGEGGLSRRGIGGENVAAQDAVENASSERWGKEFALLADEERADSTFGEFVALVEEEEFVEALDTGSREFGVIELAMRGLVAKEDIVGAGAVGGNTNGERSGIVAGERCRSESRFTRGIEQET
jgi:hypothetical protein